MHYDKWIWLIKAIKGKGGGGGGGETSPHVQVKEYNFLDYDGTLIDSYWRDEIETLTALPTPPVQHEGLVFDGWNWTLEEIKNAPFAIVGAHYKTADGCSRIKFTVKRKINLELRFIGVSDSGDITVNWGDGTESEYHLLTNMNTSAWHQYTNLGDYTVKITPNSDSFIYSQAQGSTEFINDNNSIVVSEYNYGANEQLTTRESYNIFSRLPLGGKVSLPHEISVLSDATSVNFSCKCSVILPRNILTTSLRYADISAVHPAINASIPNNAFQTYAGKFICLPGNITSIGAYAFYDYNGACIILAETPPAIETTTFNRNYMRVQIYVPDGSVSAYKAATNWSSVSGSIRPISQLV